MTLGRGRYDDEATAAREETGAQGIVLIVLAGDKGNGFAVQVRSPYLLKRLPEMLRTMAEQIERDIVTGEN